MWTSSDVQAGNVLLAVYRVGRGHPVVLAHGLTDNGRCWTHFASALADRYELIAYDARGHGASEAPADGYAVPDHAADLVALCDALGLERPAVVGHSMGAFSAAVAAAERPGRFACAVLEDPPWTPEGADSDERRRERGEQFRVDMQSRRNLTVGELIAVGRGLSPSWAPEELRPWAEAKRELSLAVFGFMEAPRPRWQDAASRLGCPTLLVCGDPDRGAIVTPELAGEFEALAPSGRVTHLPGAGHNVRREAFVPFVESVSAFLAEHV